MKKIKFIDKEEEQIIKEFESTDPKPLKGARKAAIKRLLNEAIENTVKKKRLISIRISEADLRKLKAAALKKGVSYQTFITMAIKKSLE